MLMQKNEQKLLYSRLRQQSLSTGFSNCPLLTQLRAVVGALLPTVEASVKHKDTSIGKQNREENR